MASSAVTTASATERVGRWLETQYAKSSSTALLLEPLVDPEGFGVPREMRDGPVDADGNVRWKLLPGTLGEGALSDIEAGTGKLPPALVGWLIGRHHLFQQATTASRRLLSLPPTPTHAPLRDFEQLLDDWEPLVDAMWLPIGDYDAGAGPLCLDLAARTSSGDAPVVWFDHEALHSLGEDRLGDRRAYEPLARPLYASFDALLTDIVAFG